MLEAGLLFGSLDQLYSIPIAIQIPIFIQYSDRKLDMNYYIYIFLTRNTEKEYFT